MTAVGTLAADWYGQSFQPLATPPPIALQHMAQEIDAASLLNGGTVTGNLVVLSGSLDLSAQDAVSAAGSTQATGTALTGQIANVATVTAGQGVNLLPSGVGLTEVVLNTGTALAQAYAAQGNTVDTINTIAGSIGVVIPPGGMGFFSSTKAGTIEAAGINPKKVDYIANTASAAATLTAGSMTTGDVMNIIDMTGSLSGGAALTLPTVAAYLAALPFANLNSGKLVRIMNRSAGNFAWTLTNNGSFVTVGTSTVAQTTFRDFDVIVVNGTSVTATDCGGGTIV